MSPVPCLSFPLQNKENILPCGFFSNAFKAERNLAQMRATRLFVEDHRIAPVFTSWDGLTKASCILLTNVRDPRWLERTAAGGGVRWGLSVPTGPDSTERPLRARAWRPPPGGAVPTPAALPQVLPQ